MFVCSRCGRLHTIEEFNSSRFCHDCGRFLSRINKMGKTSKEYASLERPFFPYKPYPQQLEFMNDIKNIVGKNRILVAEACNGFGKTVCTLSSILSMGKKIIYATRTHEQVRQVLIEIERINKISKNKFKAVNLASRQHLCLNEKCRKLNAIEALEGCRILREMGECSFNTEIGYIPYLPPVL